MRGWHLYWVWSKKRGVRVARLGVWRPRNDRFCNEYHYVELRVFL